MSSVNAKNNAYKNTPKVKKSRNREVTVPLTNFYAPVLKAGIVKKTPERAPK